MADLKSVSNLAWSCDVINDSLMLGIWFGAVLSTRRPWGFAVPPVLKELAISLKPVG